MTGGCAKDLALPQTRSPFESIWSFRNSAHAQQTTGEAVIAQPSHHA